jgi:2-polyprenyl-3-methyl-5-hydroxy-6-metoxy-1,4-benzoquinol methylase
VDTPWGAPPLRDRRRHGYESAREDVQRHVPTAARSILELGCSSGALGAALKARQRVSVLGVEIEPTYAADAAEVLDRVVQTSAESFVAGDMPQEAPFDCVIAADVLEHLVDPWATLRAAGRWVRPGGLAVVSLPNVLYWRAIRRVLREQRWPRDDQGIFDRTHLRWFSWRDAVQLVAEAGFRVNYVEPQYRESGRGRARVLRLSRSPLAPFLPAQLIVVGEKGVLSDTS